MKFMITLLLLLGSDGLSQIYAPELRTDLQNHRMQRSDFDGLFLLASLRPTLTREVQLWHFVALG